MKFTTLQKQNKKLISSYTYISQAPQKYHISISMTIKWLAIPVEHMFFLCGWHLERASIINGNL